MTEDIKRLREETGAGIMDAKRALQEAGGEYNKAIDVLKQKGVLKAGKKAGRTTGVGYLESYIHSGRVGVLLELRSETDFVTRSEPFRELAKNIAMHIAAMAPEDVESLLAQPYVRDDSKTINELLVETIAKTGENMAIERFCRYEI
jgi:elongation factor Ts